MKKIFKKQQNNTTNQNINILLFSPKPPPIGGIATWTNNYIDEETEEKNNVFLVNTAKIKKFKIDIFNEIYRMIYILIKEIYFLCKKSINIVHINTSCSNKSMIMDYVISIYAKIKKKKIILQCHCDISQYVNSKKRLKKLKRICKISDGILCLNRQSENFLYDIGLKDKTYLIDNFTNNKEIKEKCIIREKIKNVIFVGRITKEKGCNELIEAAKKNRDLNFYLIGNYEEDFNKNSIINQKNIYYLGEKKPKEVYELLSKNDILIFPSYAEGFPMVILEAMFVGIPIITTKVGSIGDMLGNDGGIYIEIGNTDSINEAIKKIQSKEIRKKISKRNVMVANKQYTSSYIIKKINDIYKTV